MYFGLKILCIIAWTCVIIYMALSFSQTLSKYLLNLINYGSFAVSVSIICLIGKFRKAFLDYALVFMLTVRCISTFIILHLIQNKVSGFELIDLKDLSIAIPIVAVPGFFLAIANFKFDVLFTAPMTFVCIFLANKQALTEENDNLSCFLEPKA